MSWLWPFKHHCQNARKSPDYFWKIIHWIYPEHMVAKEGFGIVFDNRQEGKPYWRFKDNLPIIGYNSWKENDSPEAINDMLVLFTLKRLEEKDWVKSWHIEKHPSKEVIEGIRYAVYMRNKHGFLDNLSLIEILDKLNEYARRV